MFRVHRNYNRSSLGVRNNDCVVFLAQYLDQRPTPASSRSQDTTLGTRCTRRYFRSLLVSRNAPKLNSHKRTHSSDTTRHIRRWTLLIRARPTRQLSGATLYPPPNPSDSANNASLANLLNNERPSCYQRSQLVRPAHRRTEPFVSRGSVTQRRRRRHGRETASERGRSVVGWLWVDGSSPRSTRAFRRSTQLSDGVEVCAAGAPDLISSATHGGNFQRCQSSARCCTARSFVLSAALWLMRSSLCFAGRGRHLVA